MKFSTANFTGMIFSKKARGKKLLPAVCAAPRRRAFTLIELMVVVAILGLIAAMGMPSLFRSFRKEGMRKAVSDIVDVCSAARAKAIFSGQPVAVDFHPLDKTFTSEGGNPGKGSTYVTSSTLPAGVDFYMLDINSQDYLTPAGGRVRFFPNGTSDEMTIILHDKTVLKKITLEFSTGFTVVSDVER